MITTVRLRDRNLARAHCDTSQTLKMMWVFHAMEAKSNSALIRAIQTISLLTFGSRLTTKEVTVIAEEASKPTRVPVAAHTVEVVLVDRYTVTRCQKCLKRASLYPLTSSQSIGGTRTIIRPPVVGVPVELELVPRPTRKARWLRLSFEYLKPR
jgi:hypothetical protein